MTIYPTKQNWIVFAMKTTQFELYQETSTFLPWEAWG